MARSFLDRFRRTAPVAAPSNASKSGTLPTFITIGSMKGGTSALHGYLRAHPQVCMSRPKETDFFCQPETADRDLSWYRACFKGRGDEYGESSPNYTKRHLFDGVAERMHAVLPDVRLIYVVRDPIDRAVSHFLHNVAKNRMTFGDFSDYFDNLDNPALLTSRYHWQIEPFVKAYGLDRVLVASSEDLRNDRADTLSRIFAFLEVDDHFTSTAFEAEKHLTSEKLAQAGESSERPSLTERQHEAIADHLRPDIDAFRALTGQDFAHWSI